MTRTVPEWKGKTPDTPIPPRVKARVFMRAGGRCEACTRKIATGEVWDCDHEKALIKGGENRESNLQALCGWCHAAKTAEEVAEKKVVARKRSKHLGIKRTSRPIPGSKASGIRKRMNGDVEQW